MKPTPSKDYKIISINQRFYVFCWVLNKEKQWAQIMTLCCASQLVQRSELDHSIIYANPIFL